MGPSDEWDTNLDWTEKGCSQVHSPASHSKLSLRGSELQIFINRPVPSETDELRDTHSHVFLNRRSRTVKETHPNVGLVVHPEHPTPTNHLKACGY